jgi:hypothetical protein
MHEAGSGGKTPSHRIRPTSTDVEALIELVVKVGTRAAMSIDAKWLMDMNITHERARSRKRLDDAPVEIERKDLEIAARELVEMSAHNACPKNDEGLKIIGSHQDCRNATLEVRSECAARARGITSGKHWRDRYRQETIELIAEELYSLIYYSKNPSCTQKEAQTPIS